MPHRCDAYTGGYGPGWWSRRDSSWCYARRVSDVDEVALYHNSFPAVNMPAAEQCRALTWHAAQRRRAGLYRMARTWENMTHVWGAQKRLPALVADATLPSLQYQSYASAGPRLRISRILSPLWALIALALRPSGHTTPPMGGVRQHQACAAAACAARAPCAAAALQGPPLSRHSYSPRRRVVSPPLVQERFGLPAAGVLARVVVSRDVAARALERGMRRHSCVACQALALACQTPHA